MFIMFNLINTAYQQGTMKSMGYLQNATSMNQLQRKNKTGKH